MSFLLSAKRKAFKEIKILNTREIVQSTGVPVKILKDNVDIFAGYICGFFNESLNCFKFPSILKRANVTLAFKKGYRGSKKLSSS